ncbi:LiaF transmembrane domain-containing protein [Acidaminobacter hydrogenoformans]|uniref:LiaF transmembrane domain-containing protein n=1 Tax=Acidaminobacter hydrogenoformans DSM 2784 TaxID=1120920 RepID=A0A1G5RUF0_9FIRM|nr:DUF5668 domain-containing protein [Acidaminobacter hydrogenoformans]SCZ77626.1 hypothetical protein SAMN03080599_00824 [Acidaminobacter hydrogenoformans DSM 2784]
MVDEQQKLQEPVQQESQAQKNPYSRDSAVLTEAEIKERDKAVKRRKHKQIADGIGIGLTFITIGIVWLLVKFDYVNVAIFRAVFDLWPLIFVVVGINIIFRRFPYIGVITWVLFVAAIILYGSMVSTQDRDLDLFGMTLPWSIVERGDRNSDAWVSGVTSGSFDASDLNGVEKATVDIALPAGRFKVGVSDQSALSYVVPGKLYQVGSRRDAEEITYSFKPEEGLRFNEIPERLDYDLYLNPKVKWDLRIDAGAMESDMILDKLPVENLIINMGAGELELRMGDLLDRARVEINCGATSIRLEVPEGVGVSVDYKGIAGEQSLTRNGFEKRDGTYYSEEYDQSTQQIELVIKSAVAEIDVNFF